MRSQPDETAMDVFFLAVAEPTPSHIMVSVCTLGGLGDLT